MSVSRWFLISGLLFLAACNPFSDGRVKITESIISMVPPKNYELSERFPGLENEADDGSFTVNVFPQQAVGSMSDLFGSRERAEPTLNNRGIHVEGTETVPFNDGQVLLFRGRQDAEQERDGKTVKITYEKWIGVFIGSRPVMVAFQEPRPGQLTKKEILEAFASVRFDVPVE